MTSAGFTSSRSAPAASLLRAPGGPLLLAPGGARPPVRLPRSAWSGRSSDVRHSWIRCTFCHVGCFPCSARDDVVHSLPSVAELAVAELATSHTRQMNV